MFSIPAYFDGTAVRPLENYSFTENQKLAIVILDEPENEKSKSIKSLRGSLSQYANPDLISKEN